MYICICMYVCRNVCVYVCMYVCVWRGNYSGSLLKMTAALVSAVYLPTTVMQVQRMIATLYAFKASFST